MMSVSRTPPRIPEVHLPEEPFLEVAAALRIEKVSHCMCFVYVSLVEYSPFSLNKHMKFFIGLGRSNLLIQCSRWFNKLIFLLFHEGS